MTHHNKPWYSLENKTIWVTGGAGYLGSKISIALDRQCRKVVCFDLGNRAAALVEQERLSHTIAFAHDLSITKALPGIIESTVAAHGLPDGVVHLSYASFGAGKTVADLPPEEFQKTFDQALTPTFVFARTLAERMQLRGSGNIVLFSSMYGFVAPDPRIYLDPLKPNPIDYGACKAAILQMSRYLAVHYGPSGVRFNCVSPGPFPHQHKRDSEPDFIHRLAGKTALRRVGEAEEVVGPTLFLLSDSASYVTGHNLVVDGGWTVW